MSLSEDFSRVPSTYSLNFSTDLIAEVDITS